MKRNLTALKDILKADYERHLKKFNIHEKKNEQCVMIGDSLIAYFPLKKWSLDTKIINHGIPGDTTGGVLDRLFLSTKLQMKKYFIHIGINDLVLTDLSFEQIAQNIITIKEEIEKACPHAEVFVISLTPVLETHEISNKDFILWRNNTQIIQINTLLFKKSTVINIHTPLLKDNRLNPEFTSDGIHLNDMGYQVYYETIKPFL